jgi:predicted transcriptional regulator
MKLSKSKSYAINWLYSTGLSINDISKELDIAEETVKQYIEKNNIPNKIELAVKSKPVKSSKDLMIRHTKEKNTNNVSIMTREASAYNDNAKKKLNSKPGKQDYIFKPNE